MLAEEQELGAGVSEPSELLSQAQLAMLAKVRDVLLQVPARSESE